MSRVVIVGAGAAGLAAANALTTAGVDVHVLEARSRIGGRIRTVTLGAQFDVDLGASWIHGPDGNPMTELASRSGTTGYLTVWADDPRGLLVFDAEGQALSATEFAGEASAFWNMINAVSRNRDTNRSVADHLSEATLPDSARPGWRWAADVGLQSQEAADLSDISLDGYNYEEKTGGDILLNDGGYGRIIDWMAGQLPADSVALAAGVTAITRDHKQWRVTCAPSRTGGRPELVADAVIVTVPIGLLQRDSITFSPPLPTDVTDAIGSIGMGVATKLAVLFDEPPWPDGTTQLAFAGTDPNDPFASWTVRTDAPLAISYAGGSRARHGESLSDDAFLAHGLARLTAAFGPLPSVVDWQRVRWGQEPESFGSYSYNSSVASRLARQRLQADLLPGLHLAGEACHDSYYGTVHGAVLSGRATAARVVADFTANRTGSS